MSIVVASLVRNEMRRFWPEALNAWMSFASSVVVLDDGSEDGTPELAEEYDDVFVYHRETETPAWGTEAPARRELFELAWRHARVDDYIFILDGDMTPARDPQPLAETGADVIHFCLYDLWGEGVYREDEFWRGHHYPRMWMIRRQAGDPPSVWARDNRGIHVGHFPSLDVSSFAYAPEDYSLLHYAYSTPELREEKYVAYASVASELTEFEIAHACSILDDSPHLLPLPFTPELCLLRR